MRSWKGEDVPPPHSPPLVSGWSESATGEVRPDCQVPGASSYKDQGPFAEAGKSRGGTQGLGRQEFCSPLREAPDFPGRAGGQVQVWGSVEDTAQGVCAGQRLEENQVLGWGSLGLTLVRGSQSLVGWFKEEGEGRD